MDLDTDTEDFAADNFTDVLLFGGLEDHEIIIKLGTVAAKIAYHNFEWRYVTLVMYNTMLHIGVESFLKNYNQTVFLKLGKFVPRHRIHVPQFVLFGQETSELVDTLQWLHSSKYDNTGMYILICTSSSYEKCNEIEMFEFLSTYYYVNSIFLKGSKDENEVVEFTYKPVLPGNCKNRIPYQLKLKGENDFSFKNLYPEKLSNLYKCPFVVSTIEQPPFMYLYKNKKLPSGGDADVIKMVADIMNATLVVTEATEFGHYEDSNWTGSLGEIFNKRAHSSMCAAPLTPQIYGNFQISFTYNFIDIVWAARLPMLKPSWEKLFYPLKMYTRVAVFFMFLFIIWTNVFLKTKFWKKTRIVLKIARIKVSLFFYAWVAFFGIPLTHMPSKSNIRVIVACWIWFSYVIRTAYQAALVSSTKVNLYEDYLENFHEVVRKKYPYGGLYILRGYYSEDHDIYSNWVHVRLTESYDVLDSILNGSSTFVIALNKELIVHHLMRYIGTRRLQIIPEKILNSPVVLYFKKFNPLRPPINRVLSAMRESGFIDTLYAQNLDRGNYFFEHDKADEVKPFTLGDVSSSFALLFLGWFLSFIYFLVEFACKKYEGLEVFTFVM